MEQSSYKEGLTLKYAADFVCTGAECPDNCCHGWQVIVDRKSYNKVKLQLSAEELASKFRMSVHQDAYDYARLKLDADENCMMLENNGLCRLHRDFGEDILSVTCRTYPRHVSVIGKRTELSLTLSCPEAARRCLLDADAMQLTKFDASDIIRRDLGVRHLQDDPPQTPYLHYVDVVRDAVLNLLAERGFPIASRLFIAGFFLDHISSFIARDMAVLEDEKLVAAFDVMSAEGMMDGLYRQFQEIDNSLDYSMSVIEALLFARAGKSLSGLVLLQSVLKCYGFFSVETDEGFELKVEHGTVQEALSSLAEQYRYRRDLLTERYPERINLYIENYCRNYWFRELFVNSPTPLAHMQTLVLRLAVLKFVFFSHEGLTPLLEQQLPEAQALELLDNVIVDSVYRFSREIEHEERFLPEMQRQLAAQGMDSFAHSVVLMKF